MKALVLARVLLSFTCLGDVQKLFYRFLRCHKQIMENIVLLFVAQSTSALSTNPELTQTFNIGFG